VSGEAIFHIALAFESIEAFCPAEVTKKCSAANNAHRRPFLLGHGKDIWP
jgi:hypothetical protein